MILWKSVALTFSCLIVSINAKANLLSVNELIDNGADFEAESINSHLTPKEDAISLPPAQEATCTNDVPTPCKKVCNIIVPINFGYEINPLIRLTVILRSTFYISS